MELSELEKSVIYISLTVHKDFLENMPHQYESTDEYEEVLCIKSTVTSLLEKFDKELEGETIKRPEW